MDWPWEDRLTTGESVATLGAVATVLGSVGPWVMTSTGMALGLDLDGAVTLLAGVGTLLVVLAREWGAVDRAVVAALGGVVIIVGALALGEVGTAAGRGSVTPGLGLYAVILGGVVTFVSAGITEDVD